MQINNIAGSLASPTSQNATQKSSKEEFLTLLVAQLENQDPLEPQSGAEFVAQLAQFTAVEQSEQTNALLAEMHAEQVSAAGASMAAFIGKSGRFATSVMEIDNAGKGVPQVSFDLGAGAKNVEAIVRNAEGDEVRRIDLGAMPPGEHSFQWDGKNRVGQDVTPGAYRIEISVSGDEGEPQNISTTIEGVIDAIDFSNGFPMMRIGGALFAPGDVLSIG